MGSIVLTSTGAADNGGGAAISTPKVIYVETSGNDATGAIGDPSKPFLTGTAAFNTGMLTGEDFVMKFGVGHFTMNLANWSGRCRAIYGCGASTSAVLEPDSTATSLIIQSLWLAAGLDPIENAYGNSGLSVYDVEFHHIYVKARMQGQSVFSTDSNTYEGGTGGEFRARCFGARLDVNSNGGGSDSGNAGFPAPITIEGSGWVLVRAEGSALTLDGGDIRGSAISYSDSFRMARCARMDGLNNPSSDLGGNAVY